MIISKLLCCSAFCMSFARNLMTKMHLGATTLRCRNQVRNFCLRKYAFYLVLNNSISFMLLIIGL